jgi:hypothetical protein
LARIRGLPAELPDRLLQQRGDLLLLLPLQPRRVFGGYTI